jgi:ribosomal protein L29
MKIAQIREMKTEELKKFIDDAKAKAVVLQFDIAAKQQKNHRELRNTKKDIAKALTVLKETESNL